MTAKYDNKVVLFLDILNFKNIINNTVNGEKDNQKEIQKVYDALYLIRECLNIGAPQIITLSKRIVQFSDSLIVSFDATEKGEIFNLICDIHFLIKRFVKNDILCRGGIAYGKLFHDDQFVFGPAFINAYYAESKAALYPRVIFDSTIKQLAEKYFGNEFNSPQWEGQSLLNMISRDTDEMWYIDYILKGEWGNSIYDFSIQDYVNKLKDIISKGIISIIPDIKVKYGWMQNKYNNLVDEWNKRYIRTDGFDMGEPEMIDFVKNMTKI